MLDALLIFDGTVASTGIATASAITVSRVSTNVLDMLANRDIGVYPGLALNIDIATTFTAGGAATLQIDYQTSADNASWVTIFTIPAVPVASLVAGVNLGRFDIPRAQYPDTGTPNRYHRLNYTVATGPMTAGALFAYITPSGDTRGYTNYPRGFTISA